nr:hypothetical protein [Tanacetum cinerariifolium]
MVAWLWWVDIDGGVIEWWVLVDDAYGDNGDVAVGGSVACRRLPG